MGIRSLSLAKDGAILFCCPKELRHQEFNFIDNLYLISGYSNLKFNPILRVARIYHSEPLAMPFNSLSLLTLVRLAQPHDGIHMAESQGNILLAGK
jgi:hypothetical protein